VSLAALQAATIDHTLTDAEQAALWRTCGPVLCEVAHAANLLLIATALDPIPGPEWNRLAAAVSAVLYPETGL